MIKAAVVKKKKKKKKSPSLIQCFIVQPPLVCLLNACQ